MRGELSWLRFISGMAKWPCISSLNVFDRFEHRHSTMVELCEHLVRHNLVRLARDHAMELPLSLGGSMTFATAITDEIVVETELYHFATLRDAHVQYTTVYTVLNQSLNIVRSL